jgi:RNA polymerase sigma factor (sigma-70 family)
VIASVKAALTFAMMAGSCGIAARHSIAAAQRNAQRQIGFFAMSLISHEPLAANLPFADFVRRVRAGDESAARELVRCYEPLIRREVRLRIEDARLNRSFDSLDVCQSVLASFFIRAACGEYDLEQPEQLVRLLVTIARNKLASKARHEYRLRRDQRRMLSASKAALDDVVALGPGPCEILSQQELLERARAVLTSDERRIAELRGEGLAWEDVAARLGGTAQARRMQLSRGLERGKSRTWAG